MIMDIDQIGLLVGGSKQKEENNDTHINTYQRTIENNLFIVLGRNLASKSNSIIIIIIENN